MGDDLLSTQDATNNTANSDANDITGNTSNNDANKATDNAVNIVDIETVVLSKISDSLVMNFDEVVNLLKPHVQNPSSTAKTIVDNLRNKGFIMYVELLGKSCLAITQKGIRIANNGRE